MAHPYRTASLMGSTSFVLPCGQACLRCNALGLVARVRRPVVLVCGAALGFLMFQAAVLNFCFERLTEKMVTAATALDRAASATKSHPPRRKGAGQPRHAMNPGEQQPAEAYFPSMLDFRPSHPPAREIVKSGRASSS